jgi:uncharacterized protein with von Willebrand factor type A (vWA) domain
VRTPDKVATFDAAFSRFFLPHQDTGGRPQESPLPREPGPVEERKEVQRRTRATGIPPFEAEEAAAEDFGPPASLDTGDGEPAARAATASYSPAGVERNEPLEVDAVDEAWVAAARALVRRVQLGPSRRWRAASKGRRFDVRRTLRTSLQTGGEMLAPRWLDRPRRRPRFIVLIDGSRSMSQYAGTALKLASALARATTEVDAFTFSTALQRVTHEIQRAETQRTHRFRPLAFAWGGGTAIGACLAEFLQRFGHRLLPARAVVIVVSDGLDVGEPETLRSAMHTLRRRSSALVWLNPLLDAPGYEPTALGMSTARPFVTTFTSANDLAGFVRLSRTVRIRA